MTEPDLTEPGPDTPAPEEPPPVIWGDPPRRGKAGKYDATFDRAVVALKVKPGTWAEIPPTGGEAYPITAMQALKVRFPGLEVTSRPVGGEDSNRHRLWARWVGEDPGSPDLRAVQ